MKISDEISLSARNLLRRKGRTALTLVGVVIGTCMVVLMISLGIAQNQANDEMIQSWGDLTQIEIYGGGISVGSDGKAIKLDDAALTLADEQIEQQQCERSAHEHQLGQQRHQIGGSDAVCNHDGLRAC